MCKTSYCKHKTNGGYCGSCNTRRKRERNPVRYAYDTLKSNSKRRGKYFELSFEEFKQFAIETNYIAGKGRSRTSYSIDRRDNTMGYFIGNIRIMTHGENSRKRNKILQYDWETKYATVTDNSNVDNGGGVFLKVI